jgi:multisubunit Na+/H+ antiporter MnhG subunit
MLMRSMPSVYSAMRGSGITTSSLILKALVWRLMAAVRLRSSQNFLRASALTATKPFAAARIGDAHHLAGGARHGVGVVADDVAHQHHLGQARRRRLLLVA